MLGDSMEGRERRTIKAIPKETAHNMFEQANSLLLHQLGDHIAEDSAYSVEPFISRTNIAQTDVIKEDLLHNEDGNSFAQLWSSLHDTKTKRNNLSGQEEVDHVRWIILHQGADDAQRS